MTYRKLESFLFIIDLENDPHRELVSLLKFS